MTLELNRIYQGDCIAIMRDWPENFVDAVVTDPPYGIRFMGKAWDGADIDKMIKSKMRKGTENPARPGYQHENRAFAAGCYNLEPEAMRNFQAWTSEWASAAMRVLKPGGHLLSFASARTYHRMATGIEDAGFEIRDQLQWIFGSGFPKSLNISKAIDKKNGDKRPVIGHRTDGVGNTDKSLHKSEGFAASRSKEYAVTSAASAASAAWDGWGTALKPANEPICLARKPCSEPTVAANVLKWGTGGLNIEAGRIESDEDCARKPSMVRNDAPAGFGKGAAMGGNGSDAGRWPANILFDQYAAGMLDAKEPGASRFFYVAKPDNGERNHGLAGEVVRAAGVKNSSGRGFSEGDPYKEVRRENFHPTVKPVDLMAYLIKLVAPSGGVVLDPFMGSGTTGIAAARLSSHFLGCELSDEYIVIAEKRIAVEAAQGKLL